MGLGWKARDVRADRALTTDRRAGREEAGRSEIERSCVSEEREKEVGKLLLVLRGSGGLESHNVWLQKSMSQVIAHTKSRTCIAGMRLAV